ncbi:MAG: phytanoyl-CoA dioxygenase family protein [Pyrinomonadaceae bacterium]
MDLCGNYQLGEVDRKGFQADGHVLLRSVLTAKEIAAFAPAIHQASFRHNAETRDLDERDTYGKAFLQTTNLWRVDDVVKAFVFARRFAQIAADLLGVERVRLYHDQALFKEPGGGATPWHQDQYYWPLATDRTITMWMPLVDIDETMGMITFASGSHRDAVIENIAISDESDDILARYLEEKAYLVAKADKMAAGDATFHLGTTIHSADSNRSNRLREIMTIIYFADGARIARPENKHQQADLNAWLNGISTGEPADGPLNPILN